MYKETTQKSLTAIGRNDIDPCHAEAYIRLENSTLDGLSRGQFQTECEIAAACVDEGGIKDAESVDQSYGV